jgi:DNA-directed RNA polymerase subunit M/transcription elongation factor TFIIS
MAGRSGKCQRCGQLFKVPGAAEGPNTSTEKKSEKPVAQAPPVEYIGTFCRVCQTRLFGRPNQVSKPLKCPDCGTETILKAPVPERAKSLPAALEGEQYELWDADNAPLPSELLAAQPKYIAINCRLCGTLMHATESQVGTELTCPDCKARTRVDAAAIPKTPRQVLVPDDEAYQLDPAFAPTDRPPVIQAEYKGMLYEQEREVEVARDAARSAQGKKVRKTDAHGRPVLPRWPLLTGVFPFLFARGVPMRWLGLTTFMSLTSALALLGIGSIGGEGGGGTAGQLSAVGGVILLAASCLIGILVLAAIASTMLCVVTESSEGNDQIHHWPTANPAEWLLGLVYVLMAGGVSAFPGWLIGQVAAQNTIQRALCTAGGVLIGFPIVLLSQLELDSPFAILSGKLLASLARCPFSWLFFYLESGLLAGLCAVPVLFANGPLQLIAMLAPLLMAAILLYVRLMGRLAWKLAETMPAEDAD